MRIRDRIDLVNAEITPLGRGDTHPHRRVSRIMAKRERKPARGVLDRPKAFDDRLSEGRAERESVPLEAHADWLASADRPDPVGMLEAQDATRVAELVPIRHGRMIV